jgi:hypothetical protein
MISAWVTIGGYVIREFVWWLLAEIEEAGEGTVSRNRNGAKGGGRHVQFNNNGFSRNEPGAVPW